MIHKLHYLGNSGVVFTVCGKVCSSLNYMRAVDEDSKVTCPECLQKKEAKTNDT